MTSTVDVSTSLGDRFDAAIEGVDAMDAPDVADDVEAAQPNSMDVTPRDVATDTGHVPFDAGQFPPACDRAHPTFIGGHIMGSDSRSVNVLIGVDHAIGGVKVDRSGVPCSAPGNTCCGGGGYSWCASVNPTLGADGTPDTTWQRTFGQCVDARITEVFFELYPKDTSGHTSLIRYGEAANQHIPVTPGHALDIGLRVPLIYDLGGNTGAVNGYITCGGRPAPMATVTRVRAWSMGTGTDCGIEGFAASADMLGTGTSGTYYRISYLEGGRCHAPSQGYTLYMDVACGGRTVTQTHAVDIVAGARPRIDWAF